MLDLAVKKGQKRKYFSGAFGAGKCFFIDGGGEGGRNRSLSGGGVPTPIATQDVRPCCGAAETNRD